MTVRPRRCADSTSSARSDSLPVITWSKNSGLGKSDPQGDGSKQPFFVSLKVKKQKNNSGSGLMNADAQRDASRQSFSALIKEKQNIQKQWSKHVDTQRNRHKQPLFYS
jgi:hypothetical protein